MFCFLALAEARRGKQLHQYGQRYPMGRRSHDIPRRHRVSVESNLGLSNSSFGLNLRNWHTLAKPAIYLYPKKTTDLSIGVMLPKEEFTATAPEFTQGTMWNVTAKPNGEIIHNGKVVPYLFWESFSNMEMNFEQGFVVKRGQGRKFLEKMLTAFNLRMGTH
ncbi:hypothetical protein TVAG_047140 [Trichomonas vaginalis G3]|uniref:Uncharacterized protein n=1 Tax=Trichomonas vaginalis (strain ATCC PRA-98 / G3) TaxID=412133 RepID=A2FHI1_TRIV3|nr:hypothetical protein TVAG_047140 [Trichomonas vaginalis G3]|eukprot:XP_001308546.1 hypothetical protein [Trichomonas vaginalis G3]